MTISKQWIVFSIAAVCAAGSGFGAHHYLKSRVATIEARHAHGRMVKLVVANEDLPKGTHLDARTVAVRAVPEEWAHPFAIRSAQFDQYVDAELDTPARRGQPILSLQLVPPKPPAFSDRIAPGRRAVTIAVDDVSSASGMIVPGDHVDLIATFKLDSHPHLLTLLENATVLATGKTTGLSQRGEPGRGDEDDRRTYTTITLDVDPDNARQILAARQRGELTAILRAPEDADASSEPEAIKATMRHHMARAVVRVIYGNELRRGGLYAVSQFEAAP
jgi:pilus assembly protein CpaB